ncbi:MAG: hypothetical protein ACRDQA_05830 [Nocardioidaceae bacterium]
MGTSDEIGLVLTSDDLDLTAALSWTAPTKSPFGSGPDLNVDA